MGVCAGQRHARAVGRRAEAAGLRAGTTAARQRAEIIEVYLDEVRQAVESHDIAAIIVEPVVRGPAVCASTTTP